MCVGGGVFGIVQSSMVVSVKRFQGILERNEKKKNENSRQKKQKQILIQKMVSNLTSYALSSAPIPYFFQRRNIFTKKRTIFSL